MADQPPARRAYDAEGRRAVAARNRQAVLTACHELLLARGYQATTIRAVAERAGVSAELVYKAFGSKPGLMKAVYDTVLAGDDEPVRIGQRPAVGRIWAMADPGEKVRAYAAFVTDLNTRLGGLAAVLAEADPEVAQVRAVTEDERLAGLRAFTAHLAGDGVLAAADAERAADECWVLTSLSVFAQLTRAREWSPGAYRDWLARMLAATLLPPAADARLPRLAAQPNVDSLPSSGRVARSPRCDHSASCLSNMACAAFLRFSVSSAWCLVTHW
jgi:AcrR family transcriptional regulator